MLSGSTEPETLTDAERARVEEALETVTITLNQSQVQQELDRVKQLWQQAKENISYAVTLATVDPMSPQRGISSVIGVVLLVAVVVVVGATVATFTLGMSEEIGSTAVATFDIEQSGIVSDVEKSEVVTITYKAGNLDATSGSLRIQVNGKPVSDYPGVAYADGRVSDITAGDTITLEQTKRDGFSNNDEIQVVTKKGDTTNLHGEKTLEGVNIGAFSFSHRSYSGKYPVFDGDVDFTYNGQDIPWKKITVTLNKNTITTTTTPELTPHGSTLQNGDTTSIQYNTGGEVSGIVRIYFNHESGQQVLVGYYQVP